MVCDREFAREGMFATLSLGFSYYCCFGSWLWVMDAELSGKFVAVCFTGALHSNQQLSAWARVDINDGH